MSELYTLQPTRRPNWYSWASLGCAFIACVPPGAVFAMVFGVRGFRSARKNGNRGLIPAVVGFVCGIAGALFFVGLMGLALAAANSTRQFLREYIANLEEGNIAAARLECDETISPQDVADLSAQLRRLGPTDAITFSLPMFTPCTDNRDMNKRFCYFVGGEMKLRVGAQEFQAALVSQNGAYHVHQFRLH